MKKLLCIFRHDYKVKKTLNYNERCVTCTRCGKFWVMNDELKYILTWDGDFSNMYGWSPYHYDKKLNKK